ncbi:MAG: endo-1,4-beta-xylanase [Polyangiaceae bacterium]
MISRSRICPLVVALGLVGCASEEGGPADPSGMGGAPPATGVGGQVAALGGASNVSGGGSVASTGTDDTSPKGGASAASGMKPTGGTSSAGGGAAGGAPSSGGSQAGGATSTGTNQTSPHIKFVGNITTDGGQVDVGNLKYKDYWNQVSPQNEGKWGSVSRAAGQYNWSALDTLYKYSKDNNIIFKEHTFVWGAQQPNYNITETDVKDWMTQFCKRYPDVAIIDVVNEPPPHTTPSYANAIGGGTNGNWAWITNAFKWARTACPKAILVLNDYNNIEWDGDNKHFIDIVNTVKSNGGPIDAIGCQSHDLDHTNNSGAIDVDVAGVTKRLNALIAAVPNIYITELDLSTKDDALQLKLYQDYWPLFWNNANVKGITIWGWVVGRTWNLAPDSGLITSTGTKRPAFTWLLQQMGKG